ncbi:MAG: hypothetical protein U0X39_05280 [Bacteroidales bacterium]
MGYRLACILLIVMTTLFVSCNSSGPDKSIARMEDGRLIFTFNLKWDEVKKKEIRLQYNLDSTLVAAAFNGKTEFESDSVRWTITRTDDDHVEICRQTDSTTRYLADANDILFIDDGWVRREEKQVVQTVKFGFNDFRNETAVIFTDSTVIFRLDGHRKASSVYLAGSFNDWSTMALPLLKTTDGWTVEAKIEPGKYTYKYIVDGKWTIDPSNLLREKASGMGVVSVFYVPNKTFRLSGYEQARNVVVTGSFMQWNIRGIRMKHIGGEWKIQGYFNTGTWAYKFIADNEWITDPDNPENRFDANGNFNSFFSIGDPVKFHLKGHLDAEKVILSGTFNSWNTNDLVMIKDSTGWTLNYVTGPGNWEYKFIIDGMWELDPDNAYTAGSGNTINSFIAVKPTHIFTLMGNSSARSVILSGNFNDWRPDGYRMVNFGHVWTFPLHLGKGKYLYKFIIDGKWIIDPANELYEDNQYGTGNSVLWIE